MSMKNSKQKGYMLHQKVHNSAKKNKKGIRSLFIFTMFTYAH